MVEFDPSALMMAIDHLEERGLQDEAEWLRELVREKEDDLRYLAGVPTDEGDERTQRRIGGRWVTIRWEIEAEPPEAEPPRH